MFVIETTIVSKFGSTRQLFFTLVCLCLLLSLCASIKLILVTPLYGCFITFFRTFGFILYDKFVCFKLIHVLVTPLYGA